MIFTRLRVLILTLFSFCNFFQQKQRCFDLLETIAFLNKKSLHYTDSMYQGRASTFNSRLNKKVQPSFTRLTIFQNG